MADYNIYIHSFGNYDSPTTPFQVREESDASGVGGEGGSGGGGFGFVKRMAKFISNPDSAVGAVMDAPAGALSSIGGKLGIAVLLVGALIKISTKVVDQYINYSSSASGDYKTLMDYSNFKQAIHNGFHPFSTEVQRQLNQLARAKDTLKSQQEAILTGGSVYGASRYGRYL